MASSRRKRVISTVIVLIVGAVLSVYLLFPQNSLAGSASQITVTGILESGVEAGCLLLRSDDGRIFTLLDLPQDTPPLGSRVMVTGTVQVDVVTSCMQGSVLKISNLSPLSQG